ncbi:pyridoxamine 5'-phosphate oxidase family protein [Streptomyces sp. HPF1205]|uniref:pyridoxamine 5'-phosphate oxidase family protein n=1 Tax=Streptomyces sp. HPF1205 TaxID=2873262 RepID=UPI001CECD9A8|nr:pyridoxamine 5'-phosphate oxidase family protein [Streptomyces sp. HPF1205]
MTRFARIAYTDSVRAVQERNGSAQAMRRHLAADADGEGAGTGGADADGRPDPLGPAEQQFIAERDGFYLATVGDTGWPYIQHRGGPPGFLHVLDAHTLAFADVRGNRQFITTGNLRHDDRAALFLMDYANLARLKLYGHCTWHDITEAPGLATRLSHPRTDGHVERVVTIRVEGYSWNCHKHITPRFTPDELEEVLQPWRDEITRLRAENEALRARVDPAGGGDG